MQLAAPQIKYFESPEDFVAWHRETPFHVHNLIGQVGRDFIAGHTLESAIDKLQEGSMEHMEQVQAILDKLEVSDMITNNMKMLESSIAGFVPNIPAYLAGQPETMFDIVESDIKSVQSPIKVVIHTSVGAWLSERNVISRGTSVIAFVMAMNLMRPVDLYCVHASSLHAAGSTSQVWGTCVKVASRPMDLARAIWMLTSPAYPRGLGIGAVYRLSEYSSPYADNIPFAFGQGDDEKYISGMRKILNLDNTDIFISRALNRYGDNMEMINDPIAWVNKMVREHSKQGE